MSFPPSQSSQRIQLIPLSNLSPNTSADEHCLSDTEHPEHLYSLGRFVAVTPQYQSQLPVPQGKTLPLRRGTQSATMADPRWTPVLLDSGDSVSSPEVKRKKGRSYLPHKGQRSHTFTTNHSNKQENVRTVMVGTMCSSKNIYIPYKEITSLVMCSLIPIQPGNETRSCIDSSQESDIVNL